MNIKNLLLVFLILSSSMLAQSTTRLSGNTDPLKYLNLLNERFLLNGDKSFDQVSSYFRHNNLDFENGSQSSLWLKETYTLQKWNSSSWQNDSSEIYTYNQNNLVSEIKIRDWSASQWFDKSRYLYLYDSYLRRSTETNQHNIGGLWVDSLKKIYDYNSQGLLSTITTYCWGNSGWENWSLMTSTYSNNQLVQDILQNWNGSFWENSQRTVYEYNSSSIYITTDIWLLGLWINFFRIVLNYNSIGFLSELKLQIYIPFSGWLNLTRLLFTYDNNYNIIEGLWQDWDDSSSSWINYSRVTTTYDPNNLPKNDLTELWTGNNNWINNLLSTHNYDFSLNLTETIDQLWNGSNWINGERDLYTYTNVSPVEEVSHNPAGFQLIGNYPNPFNSATTIRFHVPVTSLLTLKVYNSIGAEVAELINNELAPGIYDIIWNAEYFTSGIYFYRLQAGSFVETKKMTLLK